MPIRRHILLLVVLLAVSAVRAQSTPPARAMETLTGLSDAFEALTEQVGSAMVQILAEGYVPGDRSSTASIVARQSSSGSGVIVDPSGYIITNNHVVQGADQVQVVLLHRSGEIGPGGSILKPRPRPMAAVVLGVDAETDLAVLKVEATGLPHLPFGDSDQLRQGQVVLAFGSPLGLQNSVSMGVVSAVARQLRTEDPMVYIQTDAPINPGNSGGPLVDTRGRVVGINTLIFSQSGGSEGLGFAAPSNIVRTVYEQIRRYGRVRRGHIGVHAQTVTPQMAEGLGLERSWGVILGDVYPGGPARSAGLQEGDVVVSLDGKVMENGRQFDVNLYQRELGETVRVEVLRDGERRSVSVTVVERSDDPDRFVDLADPRRNLVPELGILAIDISRRVEEMLPALRKRFGVLVAANSADAVTESGVLLPGDVIFAVNGVEVTGLSSLRAVLAGLADGAVAVLHLQRGPRLRYMTFTIYR